MAASPAKIILALAASLSATPFTQPAEKSACTAPIDVKSEGPSEFDFRTGKTVMHHVAISQCHVSITADRAEAVGLDSKNSHWVFSGNVHINAEREGNMQSDQADVEFRNNQIARATVKGNPAQFEQTPVASAPTARGHAGEIVYEVGPGTIRFSQNAWLMYGQNEISGPSVVYDIRQQTARGSEGVRITIVPKSSSTQGASPP